MIALLLALSAFAATTDTIYIRGVVEPKPPEVEPIVFELIGPYQTVPLESDDPSDALRAPLLVVPPPVRLEAISHQPRTGADTLKIRIEESIEKVCSPDGCEDEKVVTVTVWDE